jgi:hypothetical protein
LDQVRFRSRTRASDEEKGAEQAKVQLRRGIDTTRKIVADYRRQLMRLGREAGPAVERPLFRWRTGEGGGGC